jgi:hypothetical protein
MRTMKANTISPANARRDAANSETKRWNGVSTRGGAGEAGATGAAGAVVVLMCPWPPTAPADRASSR